MAETVRALDLVSGGVAQTRRLGERLGELLEAGYVVLLEGEFGAGKTVFAQGVARGLGVAEYVTSPSFTLINEYWVSASRGGWRVYHIDLYRIDDPAEVLDLGLLDYVGGDGVCLIEWAERVRPLVPPEYLLIRLRMAGATRRQLHMQAHGARHMELLDRFAGALAGK